MTTVLTGDLCRITVVGPERRVDLAVPVTTPVATLLPVLLRHTTGTGRQAGADLPDGAWVLQRLGQEPFELTGTPQSLDWLEGERLYLRPAEDPLPELDFDDLADGIATAVNRRPYRWQSQHRRALFLILSVVAFATTAAVLLDRGPALGQVICAGVLAGVLGAASLVAARRLADPALPVLFACGTEFFAGLAAGSAVDDDPDPLGVTGAAIVAAALAVVAVSAVLLLAQRTVAPRLTPAPLLVAGVTGLVVLGTTALHAGAGLTGPGAAAATTTLIFAVILYAPRIAIKIARLRGPQLPKTGEDMGYDVEPVPADVVRDRTGDADTYLTVAMVTAGVTLPVLFHLVMQLGGWAGWTFVTVVSGAVLLRSRTFFGLWQRGALVAAGVTGCLMVVMRFSGTLPDGWRYALFGALVALVVPLLLAALRPWPRRMLPFWEYSATFLDVVTGLAVLPLLAQILGVYAWARGLFG